AKQIINLLLLSNNFYLYSDITPDEFKKKATTYCIRFGHSLWSANQLPVQGAKQITSLPLFSHFYLEFKKKATNYCIRFGHSLWSANQLPAQRNSKEKRRIIVYGLVTRYGPRISCLRKGLIFREHFVPKLQYFLSF
ncbi:unnamed protein product, partial [Heterotrigona itama]